MKKSGVLVKVLVIFELMVMNVQSAVIYDSRQYGEIFSSQMVYQSNAGKSFNAAIECIPGTWTGATDNYWNTPTNWCDGKVPTFATNVTIPSGGRQPNITTAAYCNNLTILPGVTLTISGSNILTVSGDLINSGNIIRNQSTVIFNGGNQKVGKGPYFNLTLRGNGIKTIEQISEAYYYGTLSMEETAKVSRAPYGNPSSKIQYDTPTDRTVGPEWPSLYTAGGITIKNTGIITLNETKTLTNKPVDITYRCGITVDENATLNLHSWGIMSPETINLKCGGSEKGSSIIGNGKLYLDFTQINVTDAGLGNAGAMITCPVEFNGTYTINVENDDPLKFTDDDLTISNGSKGGYLTKSGAGTLNLGSSKLVFGSLLINAGNVTIPVGAQIDAGAKITVVPDNGLTIQSDMNGSGSLIAESAYGNGKTIVKRYMSSGAWHIITSPLSGQTVGGFLSANGNIPSNTVLGHTSERGMRGYISSLNQWGDFYTNASTEGMTAGKGFSVRVKGTTGTKDVVFTGTLNAGDITVSGLAAGKWNCIGNPYTSAIKVNSATYTITAFLYANSANLDPLYGAIYIWDQPDVNNGMADKYTIISNASLPCEIQQAQAFMVKMKEVSTATSIKFSRSIQVHNSYLALKSTDGVWPTIKLKAMADSITASTTIAFHEGMTLGLDPTYDAGLLKAGNEMSLYTQLVDDSDIPFAIQALPADYESIVVPLGIDDAIDEKVSFSAELLHVPSTCNAILEDRLNSIFTDLSVNSYTTDLMGSTVSHGRFFLHTSYSTTGNNSRSRLQNLRAWTVNNQEMKISGEVGNKTNAMLYDIQGHLVLSETLNAGLNHTVRLPEIKPGIYILQVKEMQHTQVLKLFVSE